MLKAVILVLIIMGYIVKKALIFNLFKFYEFLQRLYRLPSADSLLLPLSSCFPQRW